MVQIACVFACELFCFLLKIPWQAWPPQDAIPEERRSRGRKVGLESEIPVLCRRESPSKDLEKWNWTRELHVLKIKKLSRIFSWFWKDVLVSKWRKESRARVKITVLHVRNFKKFNTSFVNQRDLRSLMHAKTRSVLWNWYDRSDLPIRTELSYVPFSPSLENHFRCISSPQTSNCLCFKTECNLESRFQRPAISQRYFGHTSPSEWSSYVTLQHFRDQSQSVSFVFLTSLERCVWVTLRKCYIAQWTHIISLFIWFSALRVLPKKWTAFIIFLQWYI